MKKALFLLVLCVMHSLRGDTILDVLKVQPSEQSRDFVENKKQFQLHTLLTEQRHPKTWDLSRTIRADTLSGIEALLSVDIDISEKILGLASDTTLLEQAALAVKDAILQNRKIYIYGCGATGRLAKQMESSFWRPFWKKMRAHPEWGAIKDRFPNIENRLIGEMTGADRALISSLEGLEDLQLIGKLQLEDHEIREGDVIFAVTEGGETSSVIGTVLAGANLYDKDSPELQLEARKHLYFIYNNPDDVLLPFDRSRTVITNDAITKIALFTGPQSITGSTRMQATTSETFVVGLILEQAIYQLLEPCLSKETLNELGFDSSSFKEKLLSFLPLQEAVYDTRESLSELTDLESRIYANKGFSTYFAKDALITVFIDSTERAPTFRLFPLDTWDASPRKSWIQVWTPASDKVQAWENFLGRSFYGLDKNFYEKPFSLCIEDPYLKSAALRSLANAGNEQQFFYDFSCSAENVQAHGPNENDFGVMALFSNEIEELIDPASLPRAWLEMFKEKEAKTAVILVPSVLYSEEDDVIQAVRSASPETLIVQLRVSDAGDPLKVRQHVALKMLLNAHSTGVMAKLGRVVGNTMTNVNPGNLKLIGRASFLILSHVNDKLSSVDKISYADANAILFDAIEYGKKMQKTGQNAEVGLCIVRILEARRNKTFISWEEAEALLETAGLEGYLSKWMGF